MAGHSFDRLADSIRTWRRSCRQRGGQLILERVPGEVKREVDVWGDVGMTVKMMRSLKEKFDPRRILNPGRFVV
jgi:glycolate oxidase FAD binding subunit